MVKYRLNSLFDASFPAKVCQTVLLFIFQGGISVSLALLFLLPFGATSSGSLQNIQT